MPGNTIMSHAVIPKQQYQKHQLHPVSASLLRDKHIILKPKANRGWVIFADIHLSLDCTKTRCPHCILLSDLSSRDSAPNMPLSLQQQYLIHLTDVVVCANQSCVSCCNNNENGFVPNSIHNFYVDLRLYLYKATTDNDKPCRLTAKRL